MTLTLSLASGLLTTALASLWAGLLADGLEPRDAGGERADDIRTW